MDTRQGLVFRALISSMLLLILGLILLWVWMSRGVMQLEGISLGVGSGIWLVVGFLIGKAICADRKRGKTMGRLALFLAAALDVGLPYCLEFQLPYLSVYGKAAGHAALEQITGILWTMSFATVCLCIQEHRRLRNLTKMACLPL